MTRTRRRIWNAGTTIVAIMLFGVLGSRCTAQDKHSGKPEPGMAMEKGANPDWEVATVKPSDPTETRGQRINMQGRRLAFLGTTVEQFLLLGFGVQQSQLAGLPD